MSRRRTVGRWLRLTAVVATLGAVTAGPASADGGTDQITGTGDTASAVTVHWSDGLLGSDNRTVVTPRDPRSPLSFMYGDFQKLAVTVSQTDNLVHQAVRISWTGFRTPPTALGGPDFLQIMQCYGDSNNGPDPEDCQYGSTGLLPSGTIDPLIGSRTGNVCAKPNSGPSTQNPPGAADGSSPALGCDTLEPSSADHLSPNSDGTTYDVPFEPVGTNQKVYGAATSYYDQFNTNEVQNAATGQDGSGENFFQVLSGTEAPGLGCGDPEANGQARGCWLVIVPRGQFKPNGYQLQQGNTAISLVTDSPLGASNWAQRIQIHLAFNPVRTDCPIGSAQERQMVGTGLVSHAVFSWQLALNAAANCSVLYGYSETPEATSTTQLSDTSGSSAGLAFTTIPIGSEAGRETGDTTGAGPPVVYAPIAVSAITLAFNINLIAAGGDVLTPVKLTPRLLAKALTQSYETDLVDWTGNTGQPLPKSPWAYNNPANILNDPEFRKLNPDIPRQTGSGSALAPLITEDHSGVNQQVWQWVLSDPSARAWLSGSPDENHMVVNRYYQALNLASPPGIDSYPRADPTCYNTGGVGELDPGRCATDLLPYVNDLEDGATHVRAANNPESPQWSSTALSPSGNAGWWVSNGVEPAGTVFMWTITDSANLANRGLVPADLCDASGQNCVGPSVSSLTTALASAKPDSSGLLHVDPAAPGAGGYPLTDVTYAAVRTTETPDQLTDYARLIAYAAGQGQTPGVDAGQLPRGYLPLPANLQAQARTAVTTLLADANPQPTNNSTPDENTAANQTANSTPNAQPGTNGGPAAAGTNPSGPAKPGAAKPGISSTPVLAARQTPVTAPGALRWVLFVTLVVGVVGGLAGPLMRDPSWLARQWRRIRS